MAASSTSSSAEKKYDVFISFRGEDTRYNFTSHLVSALSRKSVKVYVDYELRKGDEISPSLINAIHDSYGSLVIFSESYASSRQCLNELLTILEQRKQGHFIVPAFYNIDPSHVRKQAGSYEKAFAQHEDDPKNKEKLQRWKAALTEAANVAGWDCQSPTYRDESELIGNIVDDIVQKVATTACTVGKYKFLPKRMEARQSSHKRDDSPPILKTEDALRMRLWRIRDFLSLILSYHPTKTWDKRILEGWIKQATLAGKSVFITTQKMEDILSTSPLKHLELLIPSDIIREIEHGRELLFKDLEPETSQGRKSERRQLISSTSNIREGELLLQLNEVDVMIPVPQSILCLATNLAVKQLVHYVANDFYGWKFRQVKLTTRNEDEMLVVRREIEVALKNEGLFHGETKGIWIDASKHQVDKELTVTQEIAQQLKFITTETKFDKNLLVIVMDGNGENRLHLGGVHFPYSEKISQTTLVLLTTKSATNEYDESRMELDLEIRTEDHLLPWLLFSMNVGSELLCSSSAIQNIAVQIVEECWDRLLATVLMARSLKNVTDVEHWEIALNKLRGATHPLSDDIPDIRGEHIVDNALKNIIWEDLTTVQKQCLQHCLLLSNAKGDVPVKFLISKWVDRGSIYTPEEAEHILQQLLDRSILLKLEGIDVQLPMETHQILLSLTGFDQIVGMHGKKQLDFTNCELWEELPWEIEDLVELEKLVIVRTPVTNLPQFPNWPNLQVLHLQHNAGLTEIPSLFFEKMCELRILDLSNTNISGLPSSFFYLERLQELYIRGCELFMELPPEIKQLKTLQKLDLDKTQITHLPREIQELTNLQSLTLSFYEYDQSTGLIIPPGVISNLTNLSDLSIDVNPDDNRWDENIQIILPEFSELKGLKTLSLYIPRAKLLKYLLNQESIDFRYMIGDHKKRLISREPLAVTKKFKESGYKLRFVNGEDIPSEINTILNWTDAFFLDRHISIKSLSEFHVESVPMLHTCIVGECNEMEMLVDGTSPNKNLLLHAEFLSVYYMKNLESIWRVPIPSIPFFYHLKYIAFHTCPKLTTIFTLDFLENLSMLEDLVVEDCSRVTTLISQGSLNLKVKRFLPRLKRLLLVYLPELVSISSGLFIGKKMETMGFYYCPKLQSLSYGELSSQKLKIIKGETKWWEELNWNQWGQAGRPNKFNDIFSPINEEADVMSQLLQR